MNYSPYRHQKGVALAIVLIMLLILTVIGVTAMQTSFLQERMAGATRDRDMAFQAAESALREAENLLRNLPFECGYQELVPPQGGSHSVDTATGGSITLWDAGAAGAPRPDDDSSWSSANTYSGALHGLDNPPRYAIEVVDVEPDQSAVQFRITARGEAGARGARTLVQSHFRRSFERVVHVRGGDDGSNVVAIVPGATQLELGVSDGVTVELGGWNPADCASPDEPDFTVFYEGAGGLDTFVIADTIDLNDLGLTQVTDSLPGLGTVFSNYSIRNVLVENSGITTVAITNLGLSDRFTDDNYYCINSEAGENPLFEALVPGLLGALLGGGAADTLVDLLGGLLGVGESLVGADGLISVLPADASIIVDSQGHDRYDVFTSTQTSAIVIADLGGDDHFRMRATGDGFISLPVLLSLGGNNIYDIEGGNHLALDLDLGVANNLVSTLASLNLSSVSNLTALIEFIVNDDCILGINLVCQLAFNLVLAPVTNIINHVIPGLLPDLFEDTEHVNPGNPADFRAGLCEPTGGERISWHEL